MSLLGKITNTHGDTWKTLRQREKRIHLSRVRLRIMAVRWVWEGYWATAVADILGMTAETVSRYIASGNRGGPDALIPGKSSGQPSKIPPELTADIRAAWQQTPWAVGYGESTHWDTRIFQSTADIPFETVPWPPATTSPRPDKKFRMDKLRSGLSSFWRKKIPHMVMKNSRGGCVADLISVLTRKKSTVSVGRESYCGLSASRNHCLLAISREMGS
ncbi:MAG: hypothetical protein C7B47_14020 [Sulfobacillus thermosulfidooxidans]|uniref:Uncharacterized protein n=1 Tax=Sulfobacillus thermosulfidooxidans TaxID=28034 RepID=A0A2T2WRC1_SULTH|nr:MAG: hypothetical protein C7B47_14020 [Sulfobacillus thermosulfidooxidans]